MKFKIIKRGRPGQPSGTDVKFYASSYYSGEVDLETLGEELSEKSGVSDVDTVAVAYGLVRLVAKHLKNGNIVRLGGLGSLRISIGSDASETAAEVTSSNIKSRRLLFAPAKKMRKELLDLKFNKLQSVSGEPDEVINETADQE